MTVDIATFQDGSKVVGVAYRRREDAVIFHNDGNMLCTTPTGSRQEILPAKDREPEDEAGLVPLRRVFRYADCRDILLMIVGTVGAILHGAFYILSNVVLGLQMDAFLIYEKGNRYLLNFPDVWKRYDVTIHDLWENKSMIDLIGGMENRTDISSSHISADLNPEIFFDEMKLYTYWYVGMAGGVMIFAFCQVSLWAVASERQVRRIRMHFLRAVLRQDIGWYDRLGSGELNTRLSDDMHKIVDGLGEKFSSAIELFACFILAFIQGFFIGWKLSLVMLVIVPVLVAAALITSSVSTRLTNEELKSYAKAGKVAEEVIGSIRTVAAFGGETKETERYNNNLSEARDKGIRKGLILGLSMGGTWFVVYAAYSLGFWYGAKLIREDDSYTPGRLLIVFFSILTGAVAIGLAGPKIQAVAVARGAANTIFKIIDREPDIDSSSETGVKPQHISGNIEFRNVLFRYPTRPDVPVLNGLNLKVNVGQTVALVGASGCGKSTTVALLQRFYDPLAGSVLVDGIDIRDYNLKHLRQHVGVVGQEPILFGMSIIENIRFGRENVTDAEVIEATKQANAYDFIMKLPETFETMVGDRGAQLSGGQKQRIAIARALVRNPTILLLDEATSALDTESESTVQAALDTASHGRTTIVIAHRLSTVRNADKICSFHDGEIVEEGNHAELMKKGGIYADLVKLQSKQAEMDEKAAQSDEVEVTLSASISVEDDGSRRRDEEGSFRNASPRSFTSQLADGFRASMRSVKRVGSGFGLGATMAIKHLGDRQEQELQELKKYSVDTTTPLSSASIRRLIRLNAPEWLWIIGGCLGSLLNGAENPIFALVFTELLSVFIIEDKVEQEAKANLYCLVFIAIGFILAIAQFIMNYFFAQSGERLTMRIRKMAFRAMLRQDIAWFDDHSNSLGALTTRLATDASCVQGATGSRLGMLLRNLSNVGIGLILAFVFQWKLTLVICAFIPLIAFAGMLEMRLITGTSVGDKKGMEQAGKVALEAIENIRTVAGLTKEQKFYEMYKKRLEEPHRNSLKKGFVVGVAFAVSQAIIYVAFAVSFLYGSHLIRQEETDFNEMFMVVAMLLFGAMGIGETLAFAPDYAKARTAASKLFALFDRVPPIDVASSEGKQIDNYSGSVEFRLVRFRYPTRPTVPVLRGLTLKVTPGKTLALVGTSGCGKSTTVSLVERFYEAVGGEVMLDGIDIKQLNLQWTRNQIGIVSQEPTLFDCTIAENIAYGDNSREVTMDEIITAAKKSNIHSFIAELPLGYDTRVGDKGTQLSGGQKQRVAIARALLRNPKVLLLDEATSALDTQSERVVQEALDKARLGRTCIVIAHRLSTIQDADAIAVFHNGRVVELGTHQQLLSRRGIYYDLQQVQGKDKDK